MQLGVIAATVAVTFLVVFLAFASTAAVHPHDPSRDILRVALEPAPAESVVDFGHGAQRADTGEPAANLAEVAPHTPGAPEPSSMGPAPRGSSDRNILALDFSLKPNFNPGPDGMRVTKALAREKGAQTELPIILVDATRIEIGRAELLSALERLGLAMDDAKLPQGDRLSLDAVRRAGLDLRYDAIRDRLVLMD
ncbi:hypothetical protein [Qipengyuania gaetbuli]|uniref:hypothetical protein n=1 Tax=Qipengyuania gaetbuli TaxID=266952 RepID=UPI001CFE34CC|nr:hypothetical protein [Qipengyuania gaetbuli]